jgi:hypothetical protein
LVTITPRGGPEAKMLRNSRRLHAAAAAAAAASLLLPHRAHAAQSPPSPQPVWKFGYGSNISPDWLKSKKNLTPLDSRRCVLHGFALSFPSGRGIDFVEPTFATLKRDPDGLVHGVSHLLSRPDADTLDRQEGSYAVEVHEVVPYGSDERMAVEVYAPKRPLPSDHPEAACSQRYRDILVCSSEAVGLEAAWVQKLRALPVYRPSEETLARRASVPSPSALPAMSIAELRQHDGSDASKEERCMVSACGYIFEHSPAFAAYKGRDITFRNVLHHRGANLDANDDGGAAPFPNLARLSAAELEYALQNRDRLLMKSGAPVAVLREFWEEQPADLAGLYAGNARSMAL